MSLKVEVTFFRQVWGKLGVIVVSPGIDWLLGRNLHYPRFYHLTFKLVIWRVDCISSWLHNLVIMGMASYYYFWQLLKIVAQENIENWSWTEKLDLSQMAPISTSIEGLIWGWSIRPQLQPFDLSKVFWKHVDECHSSSFLSNLHPLQLLRQHWYQEILYNEPDLWTSTDLVEGGVRHNTCNFDARLCGWGCMTRTY